MEFKQDDSCSVQKSSCFLEIPFFKLSLTKGTLYSLDYSIEFLIEVISPDENIRNQVKLYFNKYVFKDLSFRNLHNNLRYPFYDRSRGYYNIIKFDIEDCKYIEEMLENLKKYLKDLNRIK